VIRRVTLLTCTLLLSVRLAAAHGTDSHPIRVELDLAGAFVRVAGNALTDKTVDRLAVERWRPGVSVGVRVREWLEIAAWAKSGMTLRLEEAWGFSEAKAAARSWTTAPARSSEWRLGHFHSGRASMAQWASFMRIPRPMR
jgi:hypothetical protein